MSKKDKLKDRIRALEADADVAEEVLTRIRADRDELLILAEEVAAHPRSLLALEALRRDLRRARTP